METIKIRADYLAWYSALVVTFVFSRVTTITMNKGTHFSGKPKAAGSIMAQTTANHRLDYHYPILQSSI